MNKYTKELGPGWITLVENDDHALCRLIYGDGQELDCPEEESRLLQKGFQQIMEYWTGHRAIFTLPLAPGGGDFEREDSVGVVYWRQLAAMFGIPRFDYVFAGGLDACPDTAEETLTASCALARSLAAES